MGKLTLEGGQTNSPAVALEKHSWDLNPNQRDPHLHKCKTITVFALAFHQPHKSHRWPFFYWADSDQHPWYSLFKNESSVSLGRNLTGKQTHWQSDPDRMNRLETKGGAPKGDASPLRPCGLPLAGAWADFFFTCTLTVFSLHWHSALASTSTCFDGNKSKEDFALCFLSRQPSLMTPVNCVQVKGGQKPLKICSGQGHVGRLGEKPQ